MENKDKRETKCYLPYIAYVYSVSNVMIFIVLPSKFCSSFLATCSARFKVGPRAPGPQTFDQQSFNGLQ